MALSEFRVNLQNLKDTVDILLERKVDLSIGPDDVSDFRTSRNLHYKKRFYTYLELLKQSLSSLRKVEPRVLFQLTNDVNFLDNLPLEQVKLKIEKIADIVSKIKIEDGSEAVTIPKKLPSEIRQELVADISELHKCFDVGAFRAVVILCGRILETTLHWKYFNETGIDLLEKSPGIGLGNIIAKLREKNIEFEPGITQQIHLINQVRVFSVHTKKDLFVPSQKQAEAIMLYTIDIIEKLIK